MTAERTLDLTPVSKWRSGSKIQEVHAKQLHATHIMIRPDEKSLPVLVKESLKENGYTAVKIGHTPYKSNTYAVFKVK